MDDDPSSSQYGQPARNQSENPASWAEQTHGWSTTHPQAPSGFSNSVSSTLSGALDMALDGPRQTDQGGRGTPKAQGTQHDWQTSLVGSPRDSFSSAETSTGSGQIWSSQESTGGTQLDWSFLSVSSCQIDCPYTSSKVI